MVTAAVFALTRMIRPLSLRLQFVAAIGILLVVLATDGFSLRGATLAGGDSNCLNDWGGVEKLCPASAGVIHRSLTTASLAMGRERDSN